MFSVRMKHTLRPILDAPIYLYHGRLGWLLGRRFLLLTHVGRRTGRIHQTVLEVMEYRDESAEAVVMSGFGKQSNWLKNIEANQQAKILIGSDCFAANYRLLGEDEAACVVAGYMRKNRFMAPVIRWVLNKLVGWQYGDSQIDRRRLVAQLPLVAFRPIK